MKRQFESLVRLLIALRLPIGVLAAIALLGISVGSALGADEFQDLVNKIPRSANAVVLLNMEKAKNSPLGLKEDWKNKVEEAFESGMVRVPPQATRFVLASQIDLEFMEPMWDAAVVELSEDLSMEDIAEMRQGSIDTIDGLPALARRNDTYLVKFGPKLVGAMGPANRQAVVRWVREVRKDNPPSLSPYLDQAAKYSDKGGSEIIMAIDLDGVLSPKRVAKYLKTIEKEVDAWGASAGDLAKLFSRVQGIRVAVRIRDDISSQIVIDLQDDVSALSSFAKPLLLQVLADKGAMIEDFQSWTAKAEGHQISLSGKLSRSGLRRLLSVIDSPAPDSVSKPAKAKTATPPSDPAQPVSPGELPMIEAQEALKHFKAVTGMASDLKSDMKSSKNLAQSSLWFDKYARRIERLPTLNVDPELLKYSAFVASQLRQASLVVKTMGIQSNVRQSQITGGDVSYDAGTRWGCYGGYGPAGFSYDQTAEAKAKESSRRVVRAEERGIAATDCQQIRQAIIAATAEMRRKMTEKYQIEF